MLYQHAFIAAMKQQIKQNQQKIIISQQVHYKMLYVKKVFLKGCYLLFLTKIHSFWYNHRVFRSVSVTAHPMSVTIHPNAKKCSSTPHSGCN